MTYWPLGLVALGSIALPVAPAGAAYPDKPIKLVVA